MTELILRHLFKTWLIDIDGVILMHNGYKQGDEKLLPGVAKFWQQISEADYVILLTARTEEMYKSTSIALASYGLRYDMIIFGVPTGERICINDKKPSGLLTSYAVNLVRDEGLGSLKIVKDHKL